MEPTQNQQQQPVPAQSQVSFPQPREPQSKGKFGKIIIAVVGVMIIVAIGGWFILNNNSGTGEPNSSPTPGTGGLSAFPTPQETVSPSPTPTASSKPVAKSEVKIDVLNGTGVPGEAGYLKKQLEDIDFSDITAGNADTQDATETTVTYSRDLSTAISDEITAKLKELYETVKTKKATISGGFDVSIVTGPRSKSTKATSTPNASSSPTATPTATP